MKKKLLSLALALCMVLAMLPTAALATELPQLATPTNLQWDPENPGRMLWTIDGILQGQVQYNIFKIGESKAIHEAKIIGVGSTGQFGPNDFALFCAGEGTDWDTGDYYFTAKSLGDGIEYSDSNEISSRDTAGGAGIYHYVKPDQALETPTTAGKWNWPAVEWDDKQESDERISSYWVEYGFSETAVNPNDPQSNVTTIGASAGGKSGMTNSWLQEDLIGKYGTGWYYFRFRPLSSNIEKIRNGGYSPWSAGYNLVEASAGVKDNLNKLSQSGAAEITAGVKKLNRTELENAMVADLKNIQNGTISALEALEKKVGGPAKTVVAQEMADTFSQDKISVVGAAFNKKNTGDIALNVGRASKEHVPDAMYNSTVAVGFSMELMEGQVPITGKLDVPVKITMPVPATINPQFLIILHYHTDGSYEEVLTNCYQENNQWYVSFVLNSFSDFVMIESKSSNVPTTPSSNLPTVEQIPAAGTAVARSQTVKLDGRDVQFQYYAVKDAKGNESNYVKIRDLASALNGTKAQFDVGWDGKITITPNTAYKVAGGEGTTPYSGEQSYTAVSDIPVSFNGSSVKLTSFQIKDSAGNGYTYYKLRDLGQLLNFNVKWDGGVVIETDKPYSG